MFKKCIIISLANIMVLLLLACGKNDTYTDINNVGITISNDVNNKNNKYGYQIGKPIYVLGVTNSDIDDVSAFHNSRAFVRNTITRKWAIININGKIITDYYFEGGGPEKIAPPIYDGMFTLSRENGVYYDVDGNIALDYPCLSNGSFYEGYAWVENNNHMYGFIDKRGKEIIPFIYNKTDHFSEGLACVMLNEKYGYIDLKGNIVINCKYDVARPFSNGVAKVGIKDDGKYFYYYIDNNGKPINNEKYYFCDDFYEGFASVTDNNGNIGFINAKGELVIPYQFESTGFNEFHFSSGLSKVAKFNGRYNQHGFKVFDYGFIDKKGKLIIDYNENIISNFSENLASCYNGIYGTDDGKYGIIDTNGDFVIPPVFDKVSDFSEGLALAKYNDKILILTYLNPYDLGYEQNQLLKTKNILLKNDTTGYFTSYYKQLEDNGDSVIINTSNWKEKDYKNDLDKTLKKKAAKPNTWYVTDAGIWYYFEEDRTTKKTGWYKDPEDNQTYYLHPGTGIMATGWVEIDGDMYYFNEEHSNDPNWFYVAEQDIWASAGKDVKSYGSMYINEITPDGYHVNANGVKDGKDTATTNNSNVTLNGISSMKCVKDYLSNTTFDKMDTVTFGSYAQNGNNEPVEWLLLDKQDGKALLISKYVLDCKPYNETSAQVNWDNCTLNKWFNNDFKNTVFTGDEKNEIISVIAPSINDMNNYFNDDEARKAIATKYAKDNGCWISSQFLINGDGTACYFLSDNGDTMDKAAFVGDSGKIGSWGSRVNLDDCGIRPAIWVKYDGTNANVSKNIINDSENNSNDMKSSLTQNS